MWPISAHPFLPSLVLGIASFATLANAFPAAKSSPEIIVKDICIIGGGATGTYAAVRLREDLKKTVVVVERDDHLGGHVDTYTVPGTNIPLDYGVQAYNSLPSTFSFFSRFNVPLEPAGIPPFVTKYIDLTTGKPVIPSLSDPSTALGIYAQFLQKYPYLVGGYGQLPDPIPQELLQPFSKTITDNHLEAAVSTIWTFAFGVGDLMNATTLQVVQNFGLVQLNDLFNNGFLITSHHTNSELYQKAAGLLGADVLYSSTIIDSSRDNGHTVLTVSTPTGKKIIKAKKLLVTIPPTLQNMKPFDIDDQEESVFSKWKWLNSFVAIISNTGLPDGLAIVDADPTTSFNLPKLPALDNTAFTGFPGKYKTTVIGNQELSAAAAKKLIVDDFVSIGTAGTLGVPSTPSPLIEAFASHTPLQLHPSAEDLKAGFYKKLYALQGYRSTFYTGAAWASDYSSLLWQFTDGILPLVAV